MHVDGHWKARLVSIEQIRPSNIPILAPHRLQSKHHKIYQNSREQHQDARRL
jgi:hypothetical protein